MPIPFEIAGCERDGPLASFCREERAPFPVSARARKQNVDTASPGAQLEAGIGDREVGASIAIEIRGRNRPHARHRAQFVDVDGRPGVVGFPQIHDVVPIHDAGAGVKPGDGRRHRNHPSPSIRRIAGPAPRSVTFPFPIAQVAVQRRPARGMDEMPTHQSGPLAKGQDVGTAIAAPIDQPQRDRGKSGFPPSPKSSPSLASLNPPLPSPSNAIRPRRCTVVVEAGSAKAQTTLPHAADPPAAPPSEPTKDPAIAHEGTLLTPRMGRKLAPSPAEQVEAPAPDPADTDE